MEPTGEKEPIDAGCAASELSKSALNAAENKFRSPIFIEFDLFQGLFALNRFVGSVV